MLYGVIFWGNSTDGKKKCKRGQLELLRLARKEIPAEIY
jgi:hypothetical protein